MADNDGNDDAPAERTEVVTYEETRRRAQAAASPAPKQLGRYRLDGVIAQGGMAEIWLATVEGPGRFQKKVVVKRIRPSLVKQAHAQAGKHVEMFVREAQLLSRLEHKNIVAVLELGVEPAARAGEPDEHYIVMERLEGLTLRDVALRSWHAGRPLPIELVVRFVADACLGLDHAHNLKDDRGQPANLVHRDISPDNLFVTRAGVTKLLDFGIAKREDMAALTTTGELKGKVPYMAPEQLTGARLDARTDLFAVGVVLYWLLCGRRPFDGPNDVFTMKAILDDPPRPPREWNPAIPQLLADVVMACLEKDPARRIGSAAALHDTLSVLLYGLQGPAPDPVAFVTSVEALPPATYEVAPDVAATCAQRWPGPVPAVATTSAPPSLRDAGDVAQASTMQMPLDNARQLPLRVAPVESRRIPARTVVSGADFDDAPTLPPGSFYDSTADGPSTGSGEARDRAPDAAPRPVSRAGAPISEPPSATTRDARLAEEPTVVRRAPSPPASPSPPLAPLPLPPPPSPQWSSSTDAAADGDHHEDLHDTIELNINDPRLGLQVPAEAAREPAGFASPMTLPEFPSAAALIAAAEASAAPPTDLAAAASPHRRRRRIGAVVALGVLAGIIVIVAVIAWSRRARSSTSAPSAPVDADLVVDAGTVGHASSDAVAAVATVVAEAGVVAPAIAMRDAGAVLAAAVAVDAGDVGDRADGANAEDDVDDVEERAARLPPPPDQRNAGAIVVRARAGTRVFVDGRFVGAAPLRAVPVSAGKHTVRLGFRGARSNHDVDVVAGRIAVVHDGRGGEP